MTEAAIEQVPEGSALPLVARNLSNRGAWVFAGAAAIGAVALFAVLEARRSDPNLDPLRPVQVAGEAMIVPPPPLAIPDMPPGPGLVAAPYPALGLSVPPAFPQSPPAVVPAVRSTGRFQPQSYAPASPAPYYPAALPPPPSGPATVYQAQLPPPVAAEGQSKDNARVKAGFFANPSLTIPQGAVIQAVLETALDSTRAGPARAIVSLDVRSFDGTRVLIPRGSRLYGEYKADLSSGQSRAMIQWTRLMRPDGVVIALDSPSADPLGRAGVKGKVNSHFFARFGNTLMQTVLNLGIGYATNEATRGTVILGLPGSVQNVATPQTETVRPTLKVAQGTPVSVFVARDLDFSEVER